MTNDRDASLLQQFLDTLEEYATNEVSALDGQMQLTTNELADLRRLFHRLDDGDRPQAAGAALRRGVDTSGWK